MAATVRATSSGNSGSGTSSSFAVTNPTGATTDDVVVVVCHIGGTSLTASASTGWTAVPGITFPVDQGSNSRIPGAWYRRLDGTGDDALTITLSGSATGGWSAACVQGALESGTPVATAPTPTTANTTSIDLPSITVDDGSCVLGFVHGRVPSGTSALTGWTVDADYTEEEDHGTSRSSGTSQNVQMALGSREIVTGSTLSGDTFTPNSTASLIAMLVEVLEEPAAEPPPDEEPVVDGAAVALSPRVDLLIDGVWQDITDDVRTTQESRGVHIVRGRPDERSRLSPSSARMVINNSAGDYTVRNPTGQWYGSLGRNTQLRVSLNLLEDTFARTSASGWGDADTGQSWTAIEGAATDYTVGSGVGNTIFSAAGSFRQVYAAAISRADVTVAASFKPGAVASGGAIQQALMARRQSSTTFYYALAIFGTDSNATLMIAKRVSDALTILVQSTTAVAYDSTTWMRLEFTVEGTLLLARMWDAADPATVVAESINDTSITSPGTVGIRNFVAGGNTNTFPLTLAHDDVTVDDVRFTGEVPAWPVRRDVTGRDVWVPIEAAGILRRLSQGQVVLRSALAREILSGRWDTDINAGSLLSYWPMEDAAGSTSAASGLPDGLPMSMPTPVTFGAVTGPGGSEPLPSVDSGQLIGVPVPGALGTDKGWWVAFLFQGEGTTLVPLEVRAYGSLRVWRVTVTSSAVTLTVTERHGGTVMTAAASASTLDGEWHMLIVEAYQASSTQVNALVYVDDTVVEFDTDTTHTLGHIDRVTVPGSGSSGVTSMAVGHVSVWSSDDSAGPLNLYNDGAHMDALVGFAGETAGARMVRLCGEEGIPLVTVGDPDDTAVCGPQRAASLPDLMVDAADADQGILYEPRHVVGFGYRTRSALYNQSPALALDYAGSEVAPPFEPVDDDQLTRNDITATRYAGSSARYQVTSGPLAVAEVGAYEESLSVNVELDTQLRDVAAWRAHLGTWDEERHPSIAVHLHAQSFTSSQFLTDDAADVDVGDVVTVDNLPSDRPGLVSAMVQGSTEAITGHSRTLEWNCSPAGPWTVAVLEDDDLGRLESGTSTTAAEFDAGTDTSMSVTVTGPLWSTTDEPWDILVSGVRLTVTAVSGASSPQTFTITQTPVNGVSKTIPSGSAIALWSPMRLAL